MKLRYERELIVEYGKKLLSSGLTKGTGGNLSLYDADSGVCVISPSGIDYTEIQAHNVVLIDLEGTQIEGDGRPSSEVSMHTIFYKQRDDVRAVIHTHSPFATTLACLNWEMPAHHYLVALAGPNVRCAPYATFATEELAKAAFDYAIDRKAVFLQNHGMLACGGSMEEAFYIAEEIEFTAEVYWRSRAVGQPTVLAEDEVAKLADKFMGYAPLTDRRSR
ncbi:MAG: L-fuculose-phosphate aldolase [Spirochaetaceae bacterium]|nr:MAG: L-fuculose-phosphate aldolase [Spirochaetaceae bacterium]